MSLTIREMKESDLEQIAKLHKSSYPQDHFSARLSLAMLKNYYREFLLLDKYCYVAEENGIVVGLCMAGTKTKQAVNNFIKKYWYLIIFRLLLNPQFILNKIQGLFIKLFKIKVKDSKIPLRFINMLVEPSYKGKGLGKILTAHLENTMKSDGVKEYGHCVKKTNDRVIKFHLANKCEVEFETKNYVYFRKDLTQ